MWWWDNIDDEVVLDELTLPDPFDDDDDGPWGLWWREWTIDDRPEWERELGLRKCKRCGEMDALDPLRHCSRCRWRLGRCEWCGVDKLAVVRARACSACYRWLRRNPGTPTIAARKRLLDNAVSRHRNRRSARPS